jgi:hypothetical protein
MTGLDLDGDGVTGEVPPKYTLLSTGYSTFKTAWTAGKNYRILSGVESLVEDVAGKVVSIAGKTDLASLDAKIAPALLNADKTASPMVDNTLVYTATQYKTIEPAVNMIKVVVPVKTAQAVTLSLYNQFLKNVEQIGKVMLIENPEVVK